jgi:putative membrane protein
MSKKKKKQFNSITKWLIYMVIYDLLFIVIRSLFDSIYIHNSYKFLVVFIILLILTILNQTIKPILVRLTIPITAITLGLFYPFINLFILKLVDWIMGKYFDMTNFWAALLFSILLTIANFALESIFKEKKPSKKG